jgi:hypothetical protein
MPFRRGRFHDVVERQLALFERDHAGLIRDAEKALAAYDAADREDAEERYGDYLDLVEAGEEGLVELREAYAHTLDQATADEYEAAFNAAVRKRLPRFAAGLD